MRLLLAMIIIPYLKTTTSYSLIPATPSFNVINCGNISCFNNAKCKTKSDGEKFCECTGGYRGSGCYEDIDECMYGDPCHHRGRCQNLIGDYRCECYKGWLGEDNHCLTKDNSTSVRECAKGWFGEWCMDQCFNDSMCRSNEICVLRFVGLLSYYSHQCRCAPGWLGRNCSFDIDECRRNPCPKSATCINNPGSFSCPCQSGWKGRSCDEDVDECLAYPCQHSSNCTNTVGSYICTCAEGWKGVNCEEDIDESTMNPCNASSDCGNVPGAFTCSEKSNSGNIKIIIGAVIGSFVLTGCLIIGFYVTERDLLMKS